MICVSRDEAVRRVMSQALHAGGFTVEHTSTLPSEGTTTDAVAIVVDRATRLANGIALTQLTLPVIVVGDDLDDDGLITLMMEAPVSHILENPEDKHLGVTSEKLATGDVFGLEKYLAPNIEVHERGLSTEIEKRHAIDEVCAWAEAIGARRPVVARISSVVDELVMNALRTAAGDQGRAVLRWACDADTLAVSVSDRFGSLRQHDVIDHVRRARTEKGRPQTVDESEGAGLGLYLVLANVASLVVNVEPGEQTEVVCLFDLAKPTTRGAVSAGGRSLHVFQMMEP